MTKVTPEELDHMRGICATDIWKFARTCCKTQDPQAEDPVRPWPAYDYLRQLLLWFCKARVLVVYKRSRQMMASWAIAAYSIWRTGFSHNRQVMVQSEKEDKAKALIRRMEFILKHLPPWVLSVEYSVTAQQIVFHHPQGDSWIMAVPSGPDQIRSYSPSDVLFDESAFQKEIKAAHEAAVPAIRSGGRVIHVSTPGPAEEPCAMFFKGLVENPAYQHVTLHYDMLPEQERPSNDELGLAQEIWDREFEGSFTIGSGTPVFKPPFERGAYVPAKGILFHPRLPLYRGLDYGLRHPAAVWFQYQPATGQVYFLHSWTGDNIVLPTFARYIHAITRRICDPRCGPLDRGAMDFTNADFAPFCPHTIHIDDFDDPAGAARKDVGLRSRQSMNLHRIYPWNRTKKVPVKESVMLFRQRLQWRHVGGEKAPRPGCLFNPTCSLLIQALDGVYTARPKTDENNSRTDASFTGGITEHEVDGARYGLTGLFDLSDE